MKLRPTLFALTLVAVVDLGLVGCSERQAEVSEGQTRASALLATTFQGNKEHLFAAQPIGHAAKYRLVELRNPVTNFRDLPPSETDRLNGVTDRCRLTLNASQVRYWDGQWSEWHAGTGEHAAAGGLLNVFSGGLMGEWVTTLEKKDGVWSQRDMTGIRDLSQDTTLVGSMIRDAGE